MWQKKLKHAGEDVIFDVIYLVSRNYYHSALRNNITSRTEDLRLPGFI